MNYLYCSKFEGNILVVGRTGCKKTTFIQNLGRNKIFSDIKEYQTISKISLSTERANNIRDCFVDQEVEFKYPKNREFWWFVRFLAEKKITLWWKFFGKNCCIG